MDSILSHWETVIVGVEKAQAIRNGALINLEDSTLKLESDYCRAYTWDGNLLGVLRFDTEKKQWQPEKVFN
jgi:predicted RNA-binding protein with PUA domain